MSGDRDQSWLERNSADLALLSAVALVGSACYLSGYWMSFRINILEYMAITDFVKAAALPMSAVLLALATGAALAQPSIGRAMPPGAGQHTPFGRWLNSHKSQIAAAYVVLIAVVAFFDFKAKWRVLEMLVPPFVAVALWVRGAVLAGLVPNASIRLTVLALLCTTPFSAYFTGQNDAAKVIDGSAYSFAIPTAEAELALPLHAAATYPRFLGHAGEVVFLWNPLNRAISISKIDAKQPLVLMTCPDSAACKTAKIRASAVPSSVPTSASASVAAPSMPLAAASGLAASGATSGSTASAATQGATASRLKRMALGHAKPY